MALAFAESQPGRFRTIFDGVSAAHAAQECGFYFKAIGVIASICLPICLLMLLCLGFAVTPFEVILHWLEFSSLETTCISCFIIVFGLVALQYNETLPEDEQGDAWIYLVLMAAAFSAAVYSFVGYAAVVTENKQACRAHAFGGCFFIIVYLLILIFLSLARARMIDAIEGDECFPMLRYASVWMWSELLECAKYSTKASAAISVPLWWVSSTQSYGVSSTGVGELWSVECVHKSAVAYAWEYNDGRHLGATGVPVALYGCLNRVCCDSLGRGFERAIVCAQVLLGFIIVMKCITVVATIWYAKYVDNVMVHGKKGERSDEEHIEHATRTRKNVKRNGILILLCATLIVIASHLLFNSYDEADSTTVEGILDSDQGRSDTSLGGAIPDDLTLPLGDATVTDIDYNESMVDDEYAACAAQLDVVDTSTASPPLVELVQLRTPYCTACSTWTGDAADGILPGASAASKTCISNTSCTVAFSDGSCPSEYITCDVYSQASGDLVVSDVAVTNGGCKRYSSALILAYDATNPLVNTTPGGDLLLRFSVDFGGNITFPGCTSYDVACNYTVSGTNSMLTMFGTISSLSQAIDEFIFAADN